MDPRAAAAATVGGAAEATAATAPPALELVLDPNELAAFEEVIDDDVTGVFSRVASARRVGELGRGLLRAALAGEGVGRTAAFARVPAVEEVPSLPSEPAKQLVILIDGTDNSPERVEDNWKSTHIEVLRTVLGFQYDHVSSSMSPNNAEEGWNVYRTDQRLVYYDRGLGAPLETSRETDVADTNRSALRRLWAAAGNKVADLWATISSMGDRLFAIGINTNVAQAYFFLMQNYRPGDDVFIFGFSRGAYTARLLLALLRAVGILLPSKAKTSTSHLSPPRARAEDMTLIMLAIAALQKGPRTAELSELINANGVAQGTHPGLRKPYITFVGLFDTVPGPINTTVVDDPELSSTVRYARHAVAIDEQRAAFRPLLWTPSTALARRNRDALEARRRAARPGDLCTSEVADAAWSTSTSPSDAARLAPASLQMWFAGVHSDIGGGYLDQRRMGNVTFWWMLCEAVRLGRLQLRRNEFDGAADKCFLSLRLTWERGAGDASAARARVLDVINTAGRDGDVPWSWMVACKAARTALQEAERALLGARVAPHDSRDASVLVHRTLERAMCQSTIDEEVHQTVWDLCNRGYRASPALRSVAFARASVGANPVARKLVLSGVGGAGSPVSVSIQDVALGVPSPDAALTTRHVFEESRPFGPLTEYRFSVVE